MQSTKNTHTDVFCLLLALFATFVRISSQCASCMSRFIQLCHFAVIDTPTFQISLKLYLELTAPPNTVCSCHKPQGRLVAAGLNTQCHSVSLETPPICHPPSPAPTPKLSFLPLLFSLPPSLSPLSHLWPPFVPRFLLLPPCHSCLCSPLSLCLCLCRSSPLSLCARRHPRAAADRLSAAAPRRGPVEHEMRTEVSGG